MGITEILRRILLFTANDVKSSEFGSKQPTQLMVKLNSSFRHKGLPSTQLRTWAHKCHSSTWPPSAFPCNNFG